MTSYQNLILEQLEDDTRKVSLDPYAGDMRYATVSRQMKYGNVGRMVVHHPADLRTLATIDFEFQDYKVYASINECVQPCQPKIGPRRTGIYWWTPGDPADDHELVRLRADWLAYIQASMEKEQ